MPEIICLKCQEHPELNWWYLVIAPSYCTSIYEMFPKVYFIVYSLCLLLLLFFIHNFCFLCCIEKRTWCFRALDYFCFRLYRCVSVFIIGAGRHHVEYKWGDFKQLVHMSRYIQGPNSLSLKKLMLTFWLQLLFWGGWSPLAFILKAKIVIKQKICVTSV